MKRRIALFIIGFAFSAAVSNFLPDLHWLLNVIIAVALALTTVLLIDLEEEQANGRN